MSGSIVVRPAAGSDAAWVAAQYEEIGFVPSDLARDTVVIAELDGQRIGLGRLVPISQGVAELGGIYVQSPFRGLGVARRIVTRLVEGDGERERAGYERMFCLPYEHLVPFYAGFGFQSVEASSAIVPDEVRRKHAWCLETYEPRTAILVRD